MKMWRFSLCVVFFAAAALAGMAQQAPATQSRPNAGFEKLMMLVGEWDGTHGPQSQPARLSYRLVSNGSAVEETLEADGNTMVTMYHADGERLMMTHYCAAGNQPRMRSEGLAADGKLRFTFVDVTNLASAEAGHMYGLEVTFTDADHFTQRWTWRAKGKDLVHDEFRLVRMGKK